MSCSWGTCQLPLTLPQQSQHPDKLPSCEKSYKQRQQNLDAEARFATLQKQNIFCSTATTETYPYEPSIASSASSSVSSVFSDTASQISSASSNSQGEGDETSSDQVNRPHPVNQAHPTTFFPGLYHGQQPFLGSKNPGITIQAPAPAPAPPPAEQHQHQHPRRCSLAGSKRPPPLVRQSERKLNFVDNLVDSATQMVEVIWPLSVVPCRSESGNGRGVLPLRTFIQETLRRSRTSYSTLQVALYYLILIKPHVPKYDFTMEQPGDNESFRALQCGRRMFLASLILASKYLQDRNFSARAWSKISGLKTQEINTNEMTFLTAIGWSLHIPDGIFERWTEIVLKYTPPSQSLQSPCTPAARACSDWKSIVLRLTPKLDTVDVPTPSPTTSNFSWVNSGIQNLHLPSTPTPTSEVFNSTSQEGTPTPCSTKILPEERLRKQSSMSSLTPPRFLEPKPDMPPPTPSLARMGPLPTPQLTPSSAASSTPAASVNSCPASRRPSMVSAMAQAQNVCFARTAVDQWMGPIPPPTKHSNCGLEQYSLSRRPSVARSSSSGSSPESMISDVTSRSSRSSSISSVSSALNWAPTCKLARLATCRNAKLPIPGQGHSQNIKDAYSNVTIMDSDLARPEAIISEETMAQSPESIDCFSLNQPPTAMKMPLRRKPSIMLPTLSTPHKQSNSTPRCDSSTPTKSQSTHGRKRGRSSADFSLQQNVRELLAATPSMHSSNGDVVVRPDIVRADSSSSVRSCSAILGAAHGRSTSRSVFGSSPFEPATPNPPQGCDEALGSKTHARCTSTARRAVQSPYADRHPRLPVEKDETGKKRACCCAEQERNSLSCSRESLGAIGAMERPGMREGVL